MNDILDRIDAAVDSLCACGCRQPITAASPSAHYATEACQAAWWAQTRGVQRVTGPEVDLEPLQQAATVLSTAFAGIAHALHELAAATQPLGEGLSYFIDVCYEPSPTDPVDHPLARVTAKRRNQRHGLQTRRRPPRHFRPGQ